MKESNICNDCPYRFQWIKGDIQRYVLEHICAECEKTDEE